MTPQEEIKAYLALAKDERDFETGLELLCMYSKELPVQNHIRRKHDVEKLYYKLDQLKDRPNITLTKSAVNRHIVNMTPAKVDLKPVVETKQDESEKLKSVKREDLPDVLQGMYDMINDSYKLMRSMHEKMKLAKTNADRAKIRKMIVELDDSIKSGWAVIDHWVITGEIPVVETPKEEVIDAKTVSAARTYLSKNLPKLEKMEDGNQKDLLIAKIGERYTLLLKAGNNFDDATLSILKKYVKTTSGEVSE